MALRWAAAGLDLSESSEPSERMEPQGKGQAGGASQGVILRMASVGKAAIDKGSLKSAVKVFGI
jgi:hypothetical protein